MRLFVRVATLVTIFFYRFHTAQAQILPENLNFDPCIEVDAAEVARLLNLEIAARSTHSSERVSSDIRLTGHCPTDGDVVVELVGTNPGGQSVHAERRFFWQRVEPEARVRLLAIAIAEMLPEPTAPPSAAPIPVTVAISPAPTIKTTETQRAGPISDQAKYWFRLGGGSAVFSGWTPGIILNAHVAKRIGDRTGVGLKVEGIYSAAESSVGATAVGDAVFRCVAIGPNAYFESRARFVHARAQIGMTGGVASISGQPNLPDKVEGHTVYGLWGGPEADVAAGFTMGRKWDVDLWLHAAYSLSSIRGRVVGLTSETRGGLWYASGLSLGRGF